MEFSRQDIDRITNNSFYQTIGMFVEEAKDGKAIQRLRPNPGLCWPFDGQPHGGVLFTHMDATMAWAVLSVTEKGYSCATITLDIQYIKPAKGESFICNARVTHQASQILYTRAEILDEKDQLIAAGQGTFRTVNSSF